MFKRVVKNLCLIATVVCVINGVVKGMEIKEEVKSISNKNLPLTEINLTDSFESINFHFPCFLGGSRVCLVEEWSKEIKRISKDIEKLLEDKSDKYIYNAYAAIFGISSYAFKDFCMFCSFTKDKTQDANIVFSFLYLIPKILDSLEKKDRRLYDDFSSFMKNISSLSDINLSAKELFNEIAHLIQPYMLP